MSIFKPGIIELDIKNYIDENLKIARDKRQSDDFWNGIFWVLTDFKKTFISNQPNQPKKKVKLEVIK